LIKIISLTVLFLLSIGGFVSCTVNISSRPVVYESAAVRTDTAIVDRGIVSDVIHRHGITRVLSKGLFFEVSGFNVGDIHVKQGDFVVEGQVLISLDTEHILEQIKNQQEHISKLKINQARLNEIREIDLELMKLDSNFLQSESAEKLVIDFERQQLLFKQTKERQDLVLSHEYSILEELVNRLLGTEITAPFDGQITLIGSITQGIPVNPFIPVIYIAHNQEPFIEVINLGEIDTVAQLSLNPHYIANSVKIQGQLHGSRIDLTHVPLTIYEQNFYSQNMPQPFVSAQNWLLPIRLTVCPNSSVKLPLGQLIQVYFYQTWVKDVLRIPINSLFSQGNVFYVYKINNGELIRSDIQAGLITTTFVEVLSGLQEGDEIFVRS